MNKKYKTRSGLDVRILCTDKEGMYSVVGIVDGEVLSWNSNGEFLTYLESDFDLIEQKPYSDFKVDDPVMVRDSDGDCWIPRHFSHVDKDGYACAWYGGMTSYTSDTYSTNPWSQCRRPTEEELKGNRIY